MAAGTRASRDFAATWRSQDDQVLSTTWGGTMCWFPRRPGRLRIEREGFAHIVRCGECPGCIELERRRLADRLCAKYSDRAAELWFAQIKAGLLAQAKLCNRLHRRPELELEPGFYRLGVGRVGIVARSKQRLRDALRRLGLAHRIERIRLSRGRRAFRSLTAGLMVAREVYGKQVKRWYAVGLPPAEREKFEIVKLAKYQNYNRVTSPRAWKAGNVILVPPEIWRMRKVDRRDLHNAMRIASSPELASAIAMVLSTKVALPVLSAKSEKSGKTARERPSPSTTPSFRDGGYRSSEHSQEEFFGPPLSDAELAELGPSGLPRWMEREKIDAQRHETVARQRKSRIVDESMAIIERLKELSKRRSRDG